MNQLLLKFSARASWIAAALLVISAIGWIFQPASFQQAWLFGWLYWFGISLGALVLLMLRWLTGGAWGRAILRPCEAAMLNVPAMAVLFLPIFFGLHQLYPWMAPEVFAEHEWPHKEAWFQVPFFVGRSILYLAILATLAWVVRRWSQNRPDWPPERQQLRMRQVASVGIITYFLVMLLASTDWIMSIDLAFYSTIFSVIVMISQFLTAIAAMLVILCLGSRRPEISGTLSPKQFHDLGKLLLAFTVFWGYVTISQYILIWSGNLPPEISWYMERRSGGWQWLATALAVFQFFVPFFLLLSRDVKRNPARLGAIAALVALAGVANVFWFIAPSFHPGAFRISWLDPVVFLAIGSVWIALFLRAWASQPQLIASNA